MGKLQLIAGRSHPALARKIARTLNIKLTPVEVKNFADGEIYFRVKNKVRGDDVFVFQTLSPPVNENLMELLIMIDALKRASVGRINVVCPYLAYTRQDKKLVSREPITAKLVANLISATGADRLLTIDLHADQIQGFYDLPVDHFTGYPQFMAKISDYGKNLVIVSPDVGGLVRTRKLAKLLCAPLAVIDKRRTVHNCAEVVRVIGEVEGRTAVIVDDIIDTAGTVTGAADALVREGAKKVLICATHGLLSGPAVERLEKCAAEKVLLLDTLPLPEGISTKKIEVISLAPLLAQVIRRIHRGQSLGALFTWEK